MKNVKYLSRYLAAGLLLISVLTVSAQRHYHRDRWEGYHDYYRHYPVVRTYVGVRNFGYRPYYRTNYYYGYYRPSLGVIISVLPFGYRTIYLGPNPYYYYRGIYYRPYANKRYEVIDAPVGARVPEIPSSAKAQVINGQKFYEYDGTYYKEIITDKGEILYEVVGKNAVLNTDEQTEINKAPQSTQTSPPVAESKEFMGLQADKLPDNCKAVVINQQKFYQSPSGYYYQEIINDNKISYKIVGKVSENN